MGHDMNSALLPEIRCVTGSHVLLPSFFFKVRVATAETDVLPSSSWPLNLTKVQSIRSSQHHVSSSSYRFHVECSLLFGAMDTGHK